MATQFRLSRLAFSDLDDIWDFIALDDPKAADRVQDAILDACLLLSRNPRMGSRRAHLRSTGMLIWTVPDFPAYQIVYAPERIPLQIVAILHGKRNLQKVLRKRSPS